MGRPLGRANHDEVLFHRTSGIVEDQDAALAQVEQKMDVLVRDRPLRASLERRELLMTGTDRDDAHLLLEHAAGPSL